MKVHLLAHLFGTPVDGELVLALMINTLPVQTIGIANPVYMSMTSKSTIKKYSLAKHLGSILDPDLGYMKVLQFIFFPPLIYKNLIEFVLMGLE